MRRLSLMVAVVLVSCGVPEREPSDVAQQRQALDVVLGFGTNPGNLLMYRFVPAGLPRNRPLVVLLHGCGDTAENFSRGSGFEAQATARQFALLVPQQQSANNTDRCFNWVLPANQQRGSGEL
ncbi:MAG: esterase, partial [Myxococcaceae bacterium]|nr:esterase [Myxococcaceae bacterium]